MAFKPTVAVFDACILYPFHLRNIMVQAAVDHLLDARWTDEIHDEWMRHLVANAPAIPIKRLHITKRLMNDALPNATVSGYEGHIETVSLPDPDDRHVVAAAITANASIILTWNLRDFPVAVLKRHRLTTQSPDAFFVDVYNQAPDLMVGSLANARRNLSKSRIAASGFVDILRDQKLTELAKRIKKHVSDI